MPGFSPEPLTAIKTELYVLRATHHAAMVAARLEGARRSEAGAGVGIEEALQLCERWKLGTAHSLEHIEAGLVDLLEDHHQEMYATADRDDKLNLGRLWEAGRCDGVKEALDVVRKNRQASGL